MSAHVPFDIQTIILKKLPVKSLIRFRCVSRQWKSLIETSEFIKSYQTGNDRHLLVRYDVRQYITRMDEYLSIINEYFFIIDNDAFPEHMSPITVPLSVKALECVRTLDWPLTILGCSCGLICIHGYNKDYSEMVVFWNPSIRKSVSVLLEPPVRLVTGWVGFGVCPETCDPKLVKIDDIRGKGNPKVLVYTLSTRAWKKVYLKPPYGPYGLVSHEGVCVEGFIYWLARDDRRLPLENGLYSIVSFDLSNDEFGKVDLPYNLPHSEWLMLSKCNECLTVFDYFDSDVYDNSLNYYDVWVMKDDGVRKSFTKMFRIETIYSVLELRKNGEAIIIKGRYANNDDVVDPILQVYDPCSGRVNDITIPRSRHNDLGKTISMLSISSYMETLLLLDQ